MSEGMTPCSDAHTWVCGACGKTSRTRYGFVDGGTKMGSNHMPDGSPVASPGWDESCMMHAVLCYREQRVRDSDGLKEWVRVP